jgi:hypothetical protein
MLASHVMYIRSAGRPNAHITLGKGARPPLHPLERADD